MRALPHAISCLAIVGTAYAHPAGVVEGTATAKDGDDVILQSIDIRLRGIAAPEDSSIRREPGGPEATASLAAIVRGRSVRCELDGTKARGRPVGVCFVADPYTMGGLLDIGLKQVLTGHARDCPRFSGGRYAEAEARARAAGHDLSAIYPLPNYCAPR